MNLDRNQKKRDFDQTPESEAESGAVHGGESNFVIHRHEARRLHYDLRIEMGGVLKSWAVPKGFSFDPRDKHLAIPTEDHPLEYGDFAGAIPTGQYGAGTMSIWDRGRYQLQNMSDGLRAIEDGRLVLKLRGGKLRGDWHMFRLKDQPTHWMISKGHDRYARHKNEPLFAIDLTAAKRTEFPRRRYPLMRACVAESPYFSPDWLYEVKFSGLRVLVDKQLDKIRIRDADGCDLTSDVPQIERQLRLAKADHLVADGMLVALDENSRPSRDRLKQSLQASSSDDVQLYLFDLLYYDEWDLRKFPLSERKAALASITPSASHVLYVDHERSRAEELFATVSNVGLPGLIAKRAASSYSRGVSDDWRELLPDAAGEQDGRDLVAALGEQASLGLETRTSQVKMTNRHKVLWPQDGITKGDLIDYYDHVADCLVPYLQQRPLSLNRFPHGIDAHSFYQKDMPEHLPDWVETVELASSNRKGRVRFIVCNDRATLLYLANLASIDLHPWLSTLETPDEPDWAIFDLDPNDVPFKHVTTIARSLGNLLRGVGLRPYLKTSGAKGMHVYVPLSPGYSYDQSRSFCEGVASMIVEEHGKIATVERVKSRRGSKVYIDFMQNRRGQTVVAPYVVRPVASAGVSTPLEWDELEGDLHPSMWNIHSLPTRLATRGDLFAPTLTDRQDLMPAIQAIIDRLG